MSDLYKKNQSLSQWSTGGAYLHFLYEMGPYKLTTGVECEFVAINHREIALLDTGAELSVTRHEIYQKFLDENISLGPPLGKRTISTRLGNFEETLYRVDVGLTADWGEPLMIEGTFL
jgi:hypothetical protein